MNKYHKPLYADAPVAIRQKLSALWASVMLCYVYGDFFGLFSPGKLMRMNAGEFGPLGQATPAVLVGVSVMMAIPALMIFLSAIKAILSGSLAVCIFFRDISLLSL